MNYTDPSGHAGNKVCDAACESDYDSRWVGLYLYGVKLVGDWSASDREQILTEVIAMGDRLAAFAPSTMSGPAAFKGVMGASTTITLRETGGYGCQAGAGFSCGAGTRDRLGSASGVGLVTHEYGHVFDHRINGQWGGGRRQLQSATIADADGLHVTGRNPTTGTFERTSRGYRSDTFPDMQHPINLDDDGPTAGEDFADMYMNWSRGSFAADSAGKARNSWMTTHMSNFVALTINPNQP